MERHEIDIDPWGLGWVTDVNVFNYADMDSKEDMLLVDNQPPGTAYGPEGCCLLTQLQHGAEATLHNADSYGWCVQELIMKVQKAMLEPLPKQNPLSGQQRACCRHPCEEK